MPSIDFVVTRMQAMARPERVAYLQELIGARTDDKKLLHERALLVTAVRNAKLGVWVD